MTGAATDRVAVVGGGIMGSATAFHLKRLDPGVEVVVLERDPTYRYSSTTLCEGNVRVQFNLPENIAASRYTIEVLDDFADEMTVGDFRPDPGVGGQGNLFLTDPEGREAAHEGLAVQHDMGCEVEWLDADAIEGRFLPVSGGIIGGTFGPEDGTVDASAVLQGFRRKAASLGADYRTTHVIGLDSVGDRVTGVVTEEGVLAADEVVVAAGAWTADLLGPIGVDLPVSPTMRTVFVVSTTVSADTNPCMFLPGGAYAIPEGGTTWLMGKSFNDDPVGYDFSPAPRSTFEDRLWPELVGHLPAFDRLRVERSWAGLYAVNTMDGNAILGRWPGVDGMVMATGFSGHGFQHGPAIGRYLAELLLGRDLSIDLGRLGADRVVAGTPLFEHESRLI